MTLYFGWGRGRGEEEEEKRAARRKGEERKEEKEEGLKHLTSFFPVSNTNTRLTPLFLDPPEARNFFFRASYP